jgi:hypothetical protein
VIRRHAKRLRHRTYRVTIDLDPTDDPTHGAQQLSFFNGHYDAWCYLPVMGFVSFNYEAEHVGALSGGWKMRVTGNVRPR